MQIYLDNSATTKVDKEVILEMNKFMGEIYGNSSSLHYFGREALKYVNEARNSIASQFNALPSEIFFTSGGTESDNWAIKGVAHNSKQKTKHIITSKIEHPAVLEPCAMLEKEGVSITYLDVDKYGVIDIEQLKNSINDNTILVSVMFANNEIGTIQPIKEIGEICKKEGVLFHTDAVQAIDTQKIDVNDLNIDLMSFSAHKFYGPKGVGALYKRSGVKIEPLIAGGHQERGERSGTTPVELIVGMAKALELCAKDRENINLKKIKIRDAFIDKVLTNIPHTYLNGHKTNRLPGNINISFEFIEGESLLMMLDLAGIAVSSGSACASGSLEASHVISALGVKDELSHSSIRFSMGKDTTMEEMDYVYEQLKIAVERLRMLSPLYVES
ncbi:MAG TPA: cysteine desulfurase NifS [Clostridiales bacterium]|nr:cysteine desulfurase NifS [Clostridiales bacterium]